MDGIDIGQAGNAAALVTENQEAPEDGETLFFFNGFGIYSFMDPLHNDPDKIFSKNPDIKRIVTITNPVMDFAHGWDQETYPAICKYVLEKLGIQADDRVFDSVSTGFQALMLSDYDEKTGKFQGTQKFPNSLYNGSDTAFDGNPLIAIKRYGLSAYLRGIWQGILGQIRPTDFYLGIDDADYGKFAYNRKDGVEKESLKLIEKSVIAGNIRDEILETVNNEKNKGRIPVTSWALANILFQKVPKKILRKNKEGGGAAVVGENDGISDPDGQENTANMSNISVVRHNGNHLNTAKSEVTGNVMSEYRKGDDPENVKRQLRRAIREHVRLKAASGEVVDEKYFYDKWGIE